MIRFYTQHFPSIWIASCFELIKPLGFMEKMGSPSHFSNRFYSNGAIGPSNLKIEIYEYNASCVFEINETG